MNIEINTNCTKQITNVYAACDFPKTYFHKILLFDHADAERRMVPLQQYVKWAAKFQNKISQGKDLISKGLMFV